MKRLTFLLVGFILVSVVLIGGSLSTAFAQEAEEISSLELMDKRKMCFYRSGENLKYHLFAMWICVPQMIS